MSLLNLRLFKTITKAVNTSALSLVFHSSGVLFNLLQPDEFGLYRTFSPNLLGVISWIFLNSFHLAGFITIWRPDRFTFLPDTFGVQAWNSLQTGSPSVKFVTCALSLSPKRSIVGFVFGKGRRRILSGSCGLVRWFRFACSYHSAHQKSN